MRKSPPMFFHSGQSERAARPAPSAKRAKCFLSQTSPLGFYALDLASKHGQRRQTTHLKHWIKPSGLIPRASYHNPGEQADPLPTVGVGDHVTVADGEKRDGDEPHGTQEVTGHVLLVVVPAKESKKTSVNTGVAASPRPPL